MTIKPTGTQITWNDINGEFGLGRDLGKYRGTQYKKQDRTGDSDYYEGADATSISWSNGQLFTMESVTALGRVVMHGCTPNTDYTFTKNNLPAHDQIRYQVYWHFVDSVDGVYDYPSYIDIEGERWATFTKQYYRNYVDFSYSKFNTKYYTPARYSYQPLDPYNFNYSANNGYIVFDTDWYSHTSSSYTINHHIGTNQVVTDEAMYLSHVRVRTRVAPVVGYFPGTSISFQNFYNSASNTASTYIDVQYLIVGGGGGSSGVGRPGYGIYVSGGGGGGTVRSGTFAFSKIVSYTVIIGAGGSGMSFDDYNNGRLNKSNGTRSGIFAFDLESTILGYALGGGYGAGYGSYSGNQYTDFSAGNGGGGGWGSSGGTGKEGNYGGAGSVTQEKSYDLYAAGGGGGSTAVYGGAGSSGTGSIYAGGDGYAYGGYGGAATASTITGVTRYYGGGGGGGAFGYYTDDLRPGISGGFNETSGACGGAGASAVTTASSSGQNGASNTGTGGGGSAGMTEVNGSSGGSGIVIIKYNSAPLWTGGQVDTTSIPGWTIHTFTGSGLLTPI